MKERRKKNWNKKKRKKREGKTNRWAKKRDICQGRKDPNEKKKRKHLTYGNGSGNRVKERERERKRKRKRKRKRIKSNCLHLQRTTKIED